MRSEQRLSLVVGVFVLACLAGAAAMVLSLTAQGGLFAPRYRLVAHFENVLGLQANAPIWLAGKEVGRVGARCGRSWQRVRCTCTRRRTTRSIWTSGSRS